MKRLLIDLILLCFLGCSDDSNNNALTIVGEWESSSCIPFDYDDVQDGYAIDYYEINSDGSFYQEGYNYDDLPCDSEEFTTDTWDGTDTIGQKDTTTTGETATTINLTVHCPVEAINCTDSTYRSLMLYMFLSGYLLSIPTITKPLPHLKNPIHTNLFGAIMKQCW